MRSRKVLSGAESAARNLTLRRSITNGSRGDALTPLVFDGRNSCSRAGQPFAVTATVIPLPLAPPAVLSSPDTRESQLTRDDLETLLALPERSPPKLLACTVEEQPGYVLERLALEIRGAPVRGLLTRPVGTQGLLPAMLYCHAHGARWEIGADELIDGRPSLQGTYGPALAAAGFVALCIDMPTFGERREPGESALAKALLWQGKTLMGEMLGDLLAAFDHLAARPDVDATRIATLGLSMGATHAFFLGALEPRLAGIAHLCCFADWASLVETGAHDLHGHYMTVPGLLAKTSVGAIAGMAAPRPQLVCVGDRDPLTPPEAVDRALIETRAAYAAAGAPDALTLVRETETGHVETPVMRQAVMEFLFALKDRP